MDLGEAIYREISGRSPRTEITSLGRAMDYLLAQAGSASAAARLVGVPPSSFRHWVSSGRRPRGQRADSVMNAALQLQRRARLPLGRERRLRRDGALDDIKVSGTIVVSNIEEERELDIGRYLDEVQDDLVDAYLAGASPDDLAEILHEAVDGSAFYTDVTGGTYDFDVTSLDGWR